jgi:hypothetical protein
VDALLGPGTFLIIRMTTIVTPILLFSSISTNVALKRVTTLSAQLHGQNYGSNQGYQLVVVRALGSGIFTIWVCGC